MRYKVKILIHGKDRTYTIDAENYDQILERLKLRLPPPDRECVEITSITIDSEHSFDRDIGGIYLS